MNDNPIHKWLFYILTGFLALVIVCVISELVSSLLSQNRFVALGEEYQSLSNLGQTEIVIIEENIGEELLDETNLDLVYMRLSDVEWAGAIAWPGQDKYVDLMLRHITSDGTITEDIYQKLHVGEEIEYHGYTIKLLRIMEVDWSPWNPLERSMYGFFEVNTERPGAATSLQTPTTTPTPVRLLTPRPATQPTPTAEEPSVVTPEPDILGLTQPLSELLIGWNDIEEYYDQTDIYPQIIEIFEDWEHSVRDASGEMVADCSLECTRQIWKTETRTDIGLDGKEFDYYREVIIEIYLHENAETASEHADELFDDYLPELMDEEDLQGGRHNKVSAPKNNTRIGRSSPLADGSGMRILITTSNGPISYRITSSIPPWHDDGLTEISIALDFLNTQIGRVEKAFILQSEEFRLEETRAAAWFFQNATPMGDGFLANHLLLGPHASELMHNFRGSSDPWVTGEVEGRMDIIVYAGVYQADQQQGKLIVVRKGTIWGFIGDHIDLPTRSGRPAIVDAVGKRLIIETEMGDIFYFDVPSGKFASSLDEILPTMTPGPTLTPGVTATP